MSLIKNAEHAGKMECTVAPASKLIGKVLNVMQENGFIGGFERIEDGRGDLYKVNLTGSINDCGIIKPRFSVQRDDMVRWESRFLPAQDFGVLIMTTTTGVVSHNQARENGVGGRLLAFVY